MNLKQLFPCGVCQEQIRRYEFKIIRQTDSGPKEHYTFWEEWTDSQKQTAIDAWVSRQACINDRCNLYYGRNL